MSCKQKDKCYPEFKESLKYLKNSIKPDNEERLVIEITRNIEILESVSGIMNEDQGNLIGKMIVRETDINKWEKWISEKCPNEKESETKQRYDDAEIQVIDLIHLVETENKKVFAELIAYFGTDKKRHLKTHVNLKSESENEKNELYFGEIRKIINECEKLKSRTGNIDTDFSFVITNSKKENIGDLEIIRVNLNYCLPDEVECIDKTFYFDFVIGEKEYLLIDINKLELHKKQKTVANTV